jgi:hypothetical protein
MRDIKANLTPDHQRYEGVAPIQIWLVIVAYPLWSTSQLAGSPAEALTYAFLVVIVPVVLMPWGYVLRTYVLPSRITRRGI